MSCYEWESGTIILPAAAVPALKKALRDWTNTMHDDVRVEAIRIHKEVAKSTRSLTTYQTRIREWDWAIRSAAQREQPRWSALTNGDDANRKELVRDLAKQVIETMLWDCSRNGEAPHQPKVTDVNKVIAKKTNRDNVFLVSGTEAAISFDGRTVKWSVQENNHAVDSAHEAPLAKIFFRALDKITWTRGTGGTLVGNNEYNRDDDYAGGGANYITFTYGPLGTDSRVEEMMRRGFSRKDAVAYATR